MSVLRLNDALRDAVTGVREWLCPVCGTVVRAKERPAHEHHGRSVVFVERPKL